MQSCCQYVIDVDNVDVVDKDFNDVSPPLVDRNLIFNLQYLDQLYICFAQYVRKCQICAGKMMNCLIDFNKCCEDV